MVTLPAPTGEQLASALSALGVRFVMGDQVPDSIALHRQPARLIAALAGSTEARLRLALIPLFLTHPKFAAHTRAAARTLTPPARLVLECFYTAALWLGEIYQAPKPPLPDYFSHELGISPTDDPEENLRLLAKRQQEMSGTHVDWLGTYYHAARKWAE